MVNFLLVFRILWSIAAACVLVQSCYAQVSFGSKELFDEYVSRFPQHECLTFDSLAAGASAAQCGPMTIGASGYASDGVTMLSLAPVVANAFSTTSGSNSLGVYGTEGNQFLAGNSDRIVFTFAQPINAFGISLIGNPSPTGKPYPSFWRLSINTPGGDFANSGTWPSMSLGSGNDVYFIGIACVEHCFDQVELYSDNDPYALYSFNCDDIQYAYLPQIADLSQLKNMTGGDVTLVDIPITNIHWDRFNIATANPLQGIAVLGNDATLERNHSVSLWGTVASTKDDEVALELGGVLDVKKGAIPPGPFFMNSRAVGGANDNGLQCGTLNAAGPNNIGLEAVICGMITEVGNDWIIVDDGANRPSGEFVSGLPIPGIKVTGEVDPKARKIGTFVTARGSISLWKSGENHYPLLRVSRSTDIY